MPITSARPCEFAGRPRRTSLALGALALMVAALGGCCASRPTSPATLPRPALGPLPEALTAAAQVLEREGRLELAPLGPEDEEPLHLLAAPAANGRRRDVYVIEADAFDEILIRRLGHLRELHLAPWWEGPPPAWLERRP